MNAVLRTHANEIIISAIRAVLPDEAVKRALEGRRFHGRVILVAVGKAAWRMAKTAAACLGDSITKGIVITKYGHVTAPLDGFVCYEAGHPVPDENSFRAARAAIECVSGLTEEDTVLFFLSGGGSALFEMPLIPADQLQDITNQLLACGADIVEMNTVRKRLSAVKGGRFAQACAPAKVLGIVLSDIIGDPLDMIASGPACPDSSTCQMAMEVVKKYGLHLSDEAFACLKTETPKQLDDVTSVISGSVRQLCAEAAKAAAELGYEPIVLTDVLSCQAREAGSFMAAIARSHKDTQRPLAFIAGGETVVKLTGNGKGGRNQELALSAALGIDGVKNAAVFSVGSDGTDGPTDAAGGYVDGDTAAALRAEGIKIFDVLQNNDAYHALEKCGGLIITGPTGTNVNDVAVALIQPTV